MKKIVLLIWVIMAFAAKSYSQADSGFHKISIRVMVNAVTLPLGNKYYGRSYGIGGLGVTYHFSTKFSVKLNFDYSTLPMIDPKDLFNSTNVIWDPGGPPPYWDSPYFSFSGGDIKLVTLNALFRYDFYRHPHLHFYVDAGPSINMLQSSAITGYDVRQLSNPTIYTAQSSTSQAASGANLDIGGAYYLGKHFNIFLETGYHILLFNSVAKIVISSSPLSIMPVSLGLEYAF
jgi:hypothetical protein